ncbi:MAG TPA: ATP-binding protein [archaeon]|nr:ATP-binding protein [archaeon]
MKSQMILSMETIVGRDQKDREIYGSRGVVLIGKSLVGEGEDAHLTTDVFLDVARPHVMTICGKRGEGKSHSLGTIAEGLQLLPEDIRNKLCTIIIDTQGIFWTMKTPNEKDIMLLREWNQSPKGFHAEVYVPEGQTKAFAAAGVDYDGSFSFSPSELTEEDWLSVFELEATEPLGTLLQLALGRMSRGYAIADIIAQVDAEEGFENEKKTLKGMLRNAAGWGIFGPSKMPPLLVAGKLSVMDFSLTPQNVRALMLAVIGRKIFSERTASRRKEELTEMEFLGEARVPMPWILVDEAHNFVSSDETTPSSEMLSKIVKEGRQPGISMVFATQRPMKLHPDVLSQCDIIISHRLTAEEDVNSLKAIMQTYMLFDIAKYINELPKLKGVAIILDDNSERIYKIRMKPRQSWHAGSSATALPGR